MPTIHLCSTRKSIANCKTLHHSPKTRSSPRSNQWFSLLSRIWKQLWACQMWDASCWTKTGTKTLRASSAHVILLARFLHILAPTKLESLSKESLKNLSQSLKFKMKRSKLRKGVPKQMLSLRKRQERMLRLPLPQAFSLAVVAAHFLNLSHRALSCKTSNQTTSMSL